MNDYSVSAIIPAYNAGKYICRAIDSILAQTLPVDEIIVVDDGSKDDTAEKVRSYGDKVRLVQKENGGVSSARNAGIEAASYRWVSFLDADDIWLPGKIEKLMAVLRKNPELCWAFGNVNICSLRDNRTASFVSAAEYEKNIGSGSVIDNALAMYFKGFHPNSDSGIFRRDIFDQVGLFKKYRHGEDVDMWLRIIFAYPRAGFVFDPVSEYVIDIESNASSIEQAAAEFIIWMNGVIQEAQKADALDRFRPFVNILVYKRIRSMLFHRKFASDCRMVYNEFRKYLSPTCRVLIPIALLWPSLTQFILRSISRTVRLLKLRKKVIRKNY